MNLAYDAWGQLISGSNPTPYGYKAQWGYTTDVETGILLLTHRYLDPATGRFSLRQKLYPSRRKSTDSINTPAAVSTMAAPDAVPNQ
ncbi:MAG: hypothetical protein KatS3mg022_2481 [Armatimonadota bacterium]|nr:MAG: hypothetical protein KatS3mg022_2481 [Armatimonadota bacterium]